MDTFIINVPEDKTPLVKRLLKELGVRVRKDNKPVAKAPIKLSDKYKDVFSKADAESFDRHTRSLRNEWPDT